MSDTTTIRVSSDTRDDLRSIAAQDGLTLDQVLAGLVRAERQRRMGRSLAAPLDDDDVAWLQAGAATVSDAVR